MTVNLAQPAHVIELTARTREFIRSVVVSLEDEVDGDVTAAGGDDVRRALQAEASARGLLNPHAPVDLGGRGLTMVERMPVFAAAGYSLFGAMAINAAAPMRATCTCSSMPRRRSSENCSCVRSYPVSSGPPSQ